ncbi:hypothetical protein ONZ43_g876 [Nemania bipapillata]|uniref:Uncharacterized protein n=1 Tax=Nemania bipapillata TaxID=110536 RepID=A0ACC2J6P7_9PEZI|nr:hypothetical protein ONZ43_g876 [Nemania bipapillata]
MSHGVSSVVAVPTQAAATVPVNNAAYGNSTTAAGTGSVPGATQSASSPAGTTAPVIAGAGRLSGAYVGAALSLVIALCMGVL